MRVKIGECKLSKRDFARLREACWDMIAERERLLIDCENSLAGRAWKDDIVVYQKLHDKLDSIVKGWRGE